MQMYVSTSEGEDGVCWISGSHSGNCEEQNVMGRDCALLRITGCLGFVQTVHVQCLRLALSKGPNRVSPFPLLKAVEVSSF
jgi:hypothetical protein